MAGHVKVTPELLRRTGGDVVGTADALHTDIEKLVGAQEGDTAKSAQANTGFTATQALAECESGWEQTLEVAGAKLAVTGDNLTISATSYHGTDTGNATGFRPR